MCFLSPVFLNCNLIFIISMIFAVKYTAGNYTEIMKNVVVQNYNKYFQLKICFICIAINFYAFILLLFLSEQFVLRNPMFLMNDEDKFLWQLCLAVKLGSYAFVFLSYIKIILSKHCYFFL